MSTFTRGNAKIYYEEHGSGEPLIAVHGLIENATYWHLGGVTELLSKEYRFIPMEMRGHGRTKVQGEPTGNLAYNKRLILQALKYKILITLQ